jgi:putative dimethyl sulfoxide reductase chaperone
MLPGFTGDDMIPTMTISKTNMVAHGLACKILGEAFYKPPQPELWNQIVTEQLFANWVLSDDDPFTRRGLELLNTFTQQADDATLALMRADYAALLVGPAKLKAPPWESVYLSRDHILFEKQTVEVRAFYAAYGLQTNRLHVEPDDHFGLELLFLAHLFGTALAQHAENNPVEQARIMGGVTRFIEEHLLKWAEPFLARVVYHAETDYYRGMAYLAGGMLLSLCAKLALEWELEL